LRKTKQVAPALTPAVPEKASAASVLPIIGKGENCLAVCSPKKWRKPMTGQLKPLLKPAAKIIFLAATIKSLLIKTGNK